MKSIATRVVHVLFVLIGNPFETSRCGQRETSSHSALEKVDRTWKKGWKCVHGEHIPPYGSGFDMATSRTPTATEDCCVRARRARRSRIDANNVLGGSRRTERGRRQGGGCTRFERGARNQARNEPTPSDTVRAWVRRLELFSPIMYPPGHMTKRRERKCREDAKRRKANRRVPARLWVVLIRLPLIPLMTTSPLSSTSLGELQRGAPGIALLHQHIEDDDVA